MSGALALVRDWQQIAAAWASLSSCSWHLADLCIAELANAVIYASSSIHEHISLRLVLVLAWLTFL